MAQLQLDREVEDEHALDRDQLFLVPLGDGHLLDRTAGAVEFDGDGVADGLVLLLVARRFLLLADMNFLRQLFLKLGASVGTGDGRLARGGDIEGEGVPHRCLDPVLQLDRFLVGDMERVFALAVVEYLGQPVHVQFDRRQELRRTLYEVRIRPVDRITEQHVLAFALVVVVVVEINNSGCPCAIDRRSRNGCRPAGPRHGTFCGIMIPPSWCINAAAQAAAAMWTRLISKDSLVADWIGHAAFSCSASPSALAMAARIVALACRALEPLIVPTFHSAIDSGCSISVAAAIRRALALLLPIWHCTRRERTNPDERIVRRPRGAMITSVPRPRRVLAHASSPHAISRCPPG